LISNYNLLFFANEEEDGNPQNDRDFPVATDTICNNSMKKINEKRR